MMLLVLLLRTLLSAVVVCEASELQSCTLTLDSGSLPDEHRVNPRILGCHSDTGYAHQGRALSAEMLYGNAFEQVPDPPLPTGVHLNGWIGSEHAVLDASEPLVAGSSPLLLSSPSDAAMNRGMGGEGLYLRKGQSYQGFLVIKSSSPVSLEVSLQTLGGDTLALASVVSGATLWTRVDFELIPSENTECEGIDSDAAVALGVACPLNNTYDPQGDMSDRTAHMCVRCGGQFVVALRKGGSAHVGYVSLQPGEWGRFEGLPVHLEAVRALQKIGVTAIRQGGSFELSANMDWLRQRGPVWLRPTSVDGIWEHAVIGGWGMFEMADLAKAMGVMPIITTYFQIEPEHFADLVEYCWGNESTFWGAVRASDGHPKPYEIRHFELGNEEPNPRFVEQVRAMEKRSAEVGVGETLSYILSNGYGRAWPDPSQMEEAAALGLGDRLIWDIHTLGWRRMWDSATDIAETFFQNASYDTWGAMNLETNCGDHTVERMLDEATDLNMHLSYQNPRLLARTASFCMERSGYQEGGLNDQGLIFFLPNMTWLQPPGHVHAMVAETWQPLAKRFSLAGDCGCLASRGAVSAQSSEDGLKQVIRVVNRCAHGQSLLLNLTGEVTVRTINGSKLEGANTPAMPSLIAPSAEREISAARALDLPSYSFNVFVVNKAKIELVLL